MRNSFYIAIIKNKKNRSFTLTETLVSITILVLIIGAISSLYVMNQKAFKEGERNSELNQNGRVVMERIVREIRQTDEIVTPLPDVPDNPASPPPAEILFHDGHLSMVSETAMSQGGSPNTIQLSTLASSQNDYYKDAFVKIISGTGLDQTKKIINYNGSTKIAVIQGSWDTNPDSTSNYRIDTFYYYIYYVKDNSNLKRKILVYYFSGDPDTYVSWNAEPPINETLQEQILEEEVVGEYLKTLKFWDSPVVNIEIVLGDGEKSIELETEVFGRNL
ncbi:MAG: prepilin-type N-terminal cleavage/methylation domain-containing protein [Patescibacteria group bacterium]